MKQDDKKASIQRNLVMFVENQYGHYRNFPACPSSQALVKLTGRKTFHDSDLRILEEAGFVIERKFNDVRGKPK